MALLQDGCSALGCTVAATNLSIPNPGFPPASCERLVLAGGTSAEGSLTPAAVESFRRGLSARVQAQQAELKALKDANRLDVLSVWLCVLGVLQTIIIINL